MLNTELYLAFCLATALLILLPGPIVTLVIANSLRHGTRYGIVTSLAANAGTLTLLTGAALGLTAVLALLSDIFDIVRYVGAAYLIYIGIREWRSRAALLQDAEADRIAHAFKKVFWHGYLIGITNPKTIIFFAAFFPQFLDPTKAVGPQLAIMVPSFLIIATMLDAGYAILAGRVRPFLVDAKRALIRARLTGTLLIATGIGLALARRDA